MDRKWLGYAFVVTALGACTMSSDSGIGVQAKLPDSVRAFARLAASDGTRSLNASALLSGPAPALVAGAAGLIAVGTPLGTAEMNCDNFFEEIAAYSSVVTPQQAVEGMSLVLPDRHRYHIAVYAFFGNAGETFEGQDAKKLFEDRGDDPLAIYLLGGADFTPKPGVNNIQITWVPEPANGQLTAACVLNVEGGASGVGTSGNGGVARGNNGGSTLPGNGTGQSGIFGGGTQTSTATGTGIETGGLLSTGTGSGSETGLGLVNTGSGANSGTDTGVGILINGGLSSGVNSSTDTGVSTDQSLFLGSGSDTSTGTSFEILRSSDEEFQTESDTGTDSGLSINSFLD